MFLGLTVFEKNAMITCKIQSSIIVVIYNFDILQVIIAFFSDTVPPRNLKFILYINPYGYSLQKNFTFLGRAVFEKNWMISCKIQSCTIVLINNFEILQVIFAFFSDTVLPRNLTFILHIDLDGYSLQNEFHVPRWHSFREKCADILQKFHVEQLS